LGTELILFGGILDGLIDAIAWLLAPSNWWVILQVALGLGFVIFVHELGHFLVAKACGVKCEKFYIGFDIPLGRFINWLMRRPGEFTLFGLRIPRTVGWPVRIGETEYGIGILPLGGYVKMLGQDDNPSAAEEEADRTKIVTETGEVKLDPRSYPAKSVPARMAIIRREKKGKKTKKIKRLKKVGEE
jgi:regulator of sigma E protease